MKRFFNKKLIIIFIIFIFIVGCAFAIIYTMDKNSGKLKAKENQKEIKAITEDFKKDTSEDLKPATYYSEIDIYDIMHRMANTKIIADDNKIWGELSMDKEEIQNLKETIKKIDYEDRDYLLEILERWEAEDFSKVDEEHNYFWSKLDGTIGRAIGIKK